MARPHQLVAAAVTLVWVVLLVPAMWVATGQSAQAPPPAVGGAGSAGWAGGIGRAYWADPPTSDSVPPTSATVVPNLADASVPLPVDLGDGKAIRLVVDDPAAAAMVVAGDPRFVAVETNDLFSVVEVAPVHLAWAVAALRDAGVTTIEQDQPVFRAQTVVPTDPNWSQWWGATQAGLPSAWGVTQGSADTVIAIVDTGVSPVSELTVAPGGAQQDRVLAGRSWVGGNARNDPDGHGTQSAVVAAGAINNGIGAGGACPQCLVMPLQTLTAEGVGSAADSAAAIVHAVDNGADVVSLSLGGAGGLTAQRLAVEYATANGVPVVASAGNDGTTEMNYPAAWPDTIGVAAVQQNNNLYSFSNRGSWVSVASAGCNVSQDNTGTIKTLPSYYCGTSSSAPLVAGAVALVVDRDPTATVAQVRSRVQATSTPGVATAWGMMNAAAMLTGAFPLPASAPTAPVNVTATPGDGSITVSWDAPGSDGGSPVLGYLVTGEPTGSCSVGPVGQLPPATSCTVTGLDEDVIHSFTVTATNVVGAGPSSLTVRSMPGAFSRTAAVGFGSNQAAAGTLLVDPDGEFAYVGTSTAPGVVVKVRLDTMTVVGSLQLPSGQGEQSLLAGVMDPAGEFAYFGTNTSPGRVVKVDLATFTRVGVLTLSGGEDQLRSAVVDPAGGFAYFGTDTSPGRVVKVDLATFTRVGAVTLSSGENLVRSAVVDPAGGFAYFGTNTSPGRVVKLDLATFTRVGGLTLQPGEVQLRAAAMSPTGDRAYFTTFTNPGQVVAVNLTSFTRSASVVFGDDTAGYSMVADPQGNALYIGTYANPARVVKVATAGLVEVGAIGLASGENQLLSAGLAPNGRFAYFGTNTNPGQVVAVRIASDPVVPQVPGAPSTVVGIAGDGEVDVSWSPPASDGGSAITGYEVSSSPGTSTCSTSGATTCVVDGLTNGVVYTFTVVATNAVGPGPASLPSEVVTPQAPPPPPPPVVAPGQPPVPAARVVGPGSVQVTVSPPATGDPVTSYLVTTVDSDGTCLVAQAEGSCVVDGLAQTGSHRFVAQASNAGGSSPDSMPSVPVTAGVCGIVPSELIDVNASAHFARAASCLFDRRITNNNPYKPAEFVTRAQMAAFLWRLAGEPATDPSCGFTDVDDIGVFAREGACWLKANDITVSNPYKPLDPVNRAQMAAFLWRMADRPASDPSCGFTDVDDIGVFAREGACWLKANGITTSNPYKPGEIVNRAQMAAFLYRAGGLAGLWLTAPN